MMGTDPFLWIGIEITDPILFPIPILHSLSDPDPDPDRRSMIAILPFTVYIYIYIYMIRHKCIFSHDNKYI